MAKIYYNKDADLKLLENKKVAVIGYGSQGRAHALNLKESGINTVVGLYRGSRSWKKAEEDGLEVKKVADAVDESNVVMMLVPDTVQPAVYYREVEGNLREGDMLMFAHGFNVHFNQIVAPSHVDLTMVAPKGPGHIVRKMYEQNIGVPGLVAVEHDYTNQALNIALAYARGIGCTRAGVIETTFQEETETDLFGEQVDLCGGVSEIVKAAFETLVEAGYQPEVAYFEALHELKLIVDLIYEGGIYAMWYSVSDTAQYGGMTRGKRIINEETRKEMRKILREIQSGEFAREWVLENQAGKPMFKRLQEEERNHQIEEVGRELRKMMPWLQSIDVD